MNDVIKDISLADVTSEVIEAREPHSKTFALSNGGFRKVITLGVPIHYRDANAALQDIDFTSSRDASTNYVVDKAPYILKVDPTLPAYDYTGEGGEISVELIKVGTGAFRPSAMVKSGNSYTWLVGTDTSYAITPLPFGVRTDLVLNSSKAPKTWQWRIIGATTLLKPIVGLDANGNFCQITQNLVGDVLTATWSGKVASRLALRRDPTNAWTNTATYPVTIDPTVNEAIAAGGDDGHTYTGGTGGTVQNLTATRIFAGNFAGSAAAPKNYAGLRFTTINIPQGETINTATLTVNVIQHTGSPSTRWYADNVNDAAAWGTGSRIKNITKTTAFAAFAPTTNGSKNIDVKSIVQEIINRAGWVANNNMRFGLFDQLGTGTNMVTMEALENAGTAHATLVIDYGAAVTSHYFIRQPAFTGGFNRMTGGFDG